MGYCSWICFGLPGSTLVVEVAPSSLLLFAFTFTKFMIRYPIPPLEPLAHAQTFKGRRYLHSISIDDHASPQKHNCYLHAIAYSIQHTLFPLPQSQSLSSSNDKLNRQFRVLSSLCPFQPQFFPSPVVELIFSGGASWILLHLHIYASDH